SLASLETDLQRYLITNKINIIPAVSSFVGIEVPNIKRKLITLGDVATTQTFTNTKAILPMCVGVDTLGNSVVADLASAPHLLIAGTTGSGKSAGLNSMLISLLLARSPAELRLIMVDPKTVEFTQYQGLPHLLCPIITDPMSAASALAWLIKEQERRYKLLAKLRVSKISQCNDLIRTKNANNEVVYDPLWTPDMGGEAPILKPLPYLVLVIDEYADLAAVASSTGRKGEKSMEGMIGRLAGKARAAGIHIILATQTPRAEIITGTIRANMPSRIAYTVQNGNESRIILDETGAENLLGNGDMLIKYQGLRNTEKFRAHGPFASNHDVESVVKSWIEYAGDPEYVDGVTEGEDEEETAEIQSPQEPVNKLDEKFDEVVAHARVFCTTTNRALSVSELQTTFSFGYNRAKKIHRQLQKEGIIDEKGFLVSHGY
ncbi:MAG: FtsK/SpoIIIE domain-containing protein, partial [Succinivibrio sp.]